MIIFRLLYVIIYEDLLTDLKIHLENNKVQWGTYIYTCNGGLHVFINRIGVTYGLSKIYYFKAKNKAKKQFYWQFIFSQIPS